jgi:CDP-6-deoxy-D-xylo-4-hexulose-3-dehydrase
LSFIPAFSTPIVARTKELRNKYYERFKDKVEIRPIICGNITRQPFWKKYMKHEYSLSGTDFIDNNGFYFTNDQALTIKEIDLIKELLSV